MHVHDLAPFAGSTLDFSHTINKLSFGLPYPGMKNPLDGQHNPPTRGALGAKAPDAGMFQYFLKVSTPQVTLQVRSAHLRQP
jgi:endoplasmic reticulum-Golgi intermediate compartment protein 3